MARQTPVHSGYTILNGTATGSAGGRIDVWVEYTLGTQSITGNFTPITAYFYAARNPDYSPSVSDIAGVNASFRVNGAADTGVSNGVCNFAANTVNLLGSYSGNIRHNSDGTKNLTILGSFTTPSSYLSGGSVTATVSLPAIPRASAITATDGIITGSANLTIRPYTAGLTHSIAWAFGDLSGYVSADGTMGDAEERFSATGLEVILPERFYSQIPNDTQGVCTLLCNTWSGDRFVGQSRCSFTVRTEKALCIPMVTGAVEDCNPATLALTGDKHTLVSGRSHALCAVTAQAKNGASIVRTAIDGMVVTGGSRTLEAIETDTVAFAATDSRGYAGKDTVTLPLIPYIRLTCDASVKRTDPSNGDAAVTLKGQCFKGSFGTAENALTVTCQVAGQTLTVNPTLGDDNSYAITVPISGLDNTREDQLTVTAQDRLDTVTKTLTVQQGIPVFDWGQQDFQFHVPVTGDFLGTFQGAYIRTAYVSDTSKLQLQTRFPQFQEGIAGRQSIFLLGTANGAPVYGLITIYGNGSSPAWSGTDGTSVSLETGGQITVKLPLPAWDTFVLVSAQPFEIV